MLWSRRRSRRSVHLPSMARVTAASPATLHAGKGDVDRPGLPRVGQAVSNRKERTRVLLGDAPVHDRFRAMLGALLEPSAHLLHRHCRRS